MALRFGFAGFGHGHIYGLHRKVVESGNSGRELAFAGAFEDDPTSRKEAGEHGVPVAHDSIASLLAEGCEVVAIGADFARRGSLAIAALEAGKHVIADKPLCTSLAELETIRRLSKAKNLKVGCMLTMRDSPVMRGLRDRVREGRIGLVHGIAFGGQHPLNEATRARWYFEPGKHGGTITDIFVHAADSIPWVTGLTYARVNAARCWNAMAKAHRGFKDGAQMMLTMSNGCGVLGDVSYFMPSKGGYSLPFYWRTTLFGEKGIAEVAATRDSVAMAVDGEVRSEAPAPGGRYASYLDSFVADIAGKREGEDALDTDAVLRATQVALTVQKAADENLHDLAL